MNSNFHLSDSELVSTLEVGASSNELDWLGQMKERIENRCRGFDPRAIVQDCALVAATQGNGKGKGIARGMIFSSLKSAGFGPLLACEQLF